VSRLTRAAIGRWSLPVLGNVHEVIGSMPWTMIWSIRAIGNEAGQLNPNPLPAAKFLTLSRSLLGPRTEGSGAT